MTLIGWVEAWSVDREYYDQEIVFYHFDTSCRECNIPDIVISTKNGWDSKRLNVLQCLQLILRMILFVGLNFMEERPQAHHRIAVLELVTDNGIIHTKPKTDFKTLPKRSARLRNERGVLHGS